MTRIYSKTETFVRSHFSGQEDHQTLRKKIISLPRQVRVDIKTAAAERGCTSKKDQVTEAVFWILHDLKSEPVAVCPVCSKEYRGFFYSMAEGYHFHDHCSASCRTKNPEVQEKMAATNLERHGHRNNMHGQKIREKTKAGWVEKYGTEFPTQSEQILSKVRATNRARRGVDWPSQDRQVLEKYKITMLERHGVDNSFKTGNSQKTCMERYGVPNPMMNPVIFRKSLRSLKRTKEGVTLSGQKYTYQGYENVAMNELTTMLQDEQIFIGDPTQIPVIDYFNPVKGKDSRYFPDIWIPSMNLLIEVKSTWTLKRQMAENMAKHAAAKRLGFKHEIWVCSDSAVLEVLL